MKSINRINYTNIAFILLSAIVATYAPFELFLLAYALLGPAHYLTEISWLHDRRYFSTGRFDWVILVLPFSLSVAAQLCGMQYREELYALLLLNSFFWAGLMAFVQPGPIRTSIGMALLVVAALCVAILGRATVIGITVLPTIVHVYVFTGIFMLYGAMKSDEISGYLALGCYLAAPLLCLNLELSPVDYAGVRAFDDHLSPFIPLRELLQQVLRLPIDNTGALAVMRLLAFAYTYHYLNWFSKTEIINWHRASKRRLAALSIVYLVSIGTYAYDYQLGLMALLALSLAHVILEFPLNFRSITGIHTGIRARIRGY